MIDNNLILYLPFDDPDGSKAGLMQRFLMVLHSPK